MHNSSKELELCNNISKKKRLAKCLEIKCIATGGCNFIYSTYTSTRVSKTNQAGQNPFDINARSIISCCEIYHYCEKLGTSLEERDQFCPKTELSWCKYQSDIVNGTATYRHKPGIHTPFYINARSIISCCEIYHCCEKLHHWRKEINFVQQLNCRGVSTKAILLMAPPHTNTSQGYIQH